MSDEDKKPVSQTPRTLTDADVTTQPTLGRRSMLGMVGVAAGTAAMIAGQAPAEAQQAGVNDRDGPPNPNADPPNLGRGYGRGTICNGRYNQNNTHGISLKYVHTRLR